MRCLCVVFFFAIALYANGQHADKDISSVAGTTQVGYASYYHNRFHGRITTSGERYSRNKLTAAHRTLPLGTRVKVTDPKTGRWVIVRINDRGPRPKRRIIDLSLRAARHLGMLNGKGVLKVKIETLPEVELIPDNSFRRNEAQ